MKRLSILLLPLLLAACNTKPDTVELTEWQFEYNGQWYPATVLGFIHNDLMANGLIPDPYYGTNEDSVQWVGDSTWRYSTTIRFDSLPYGDSLWLVFDGLAGNATIIWGGFELQETVHDNMYTQAVLPIRSDGLAYVDDLSIDIYFKPLNDSLRQATYGIPLPDRRAFTRIAPYQQGWDWGPKLPTCGIWKRVYITNKRPNNRSIQNIPNTPRTEFRQEQDSIGQSFAFYRDGKPLFIKGANWIPVHSFPVDDSANRARYRYLLTSAKEAGFNMLRVWGGGIYEHDYFYDLCDSLGLMVWQDFNFSCALYPDNPEMLESIKEEARQNVSRIARHPCIVLWCGNNEVKNGWEDWGWQDQYHWNPEQRARLQHAIDTIFGTVGTRRAVSASDGPSTADTPTTILAQAVRDCDPLQRPYITTSPLYGWGHPECTTHGDSHYWGVWWGEEPFERYKEKTGRFMSEYGFQSYPMMSTIRRFCPDDQLSIDSPTLRNHQKHGRGREIIDKAMRQYYGFDSRSLGLDDYAYVSQLLQAWGVGYGILCHLRDPRCAGTLYWQLNDCWPVASWSSIDYYGNWKALHYRAQALYHLTPDPSPRGERSEYQYRKALHDWEQYYSVYPKDRTYPEPRYTTTFEIKGKTLEVTVIAESDLYDVYIDTDPHIDGHFTRNFVDLRAGDTLTATLVPVDPEADLAHVKVAIRTLNDIYRNNR